MLRSFSITILTYLDAQNHLPLCRLTTKGLTAKWTDPDGTLRQFQAHTPTCFLDSGRPSREWSSTTFTLRQSCRYHFCEWLIRRKSRSGLLVVWWTLFPRDQRPRAIYLKNRWMNGYTRWREGKRNQETDHVDDKYFILRIIFVASWRGCPTIY